MGTSTSSTTSTMSTAATTTVTTNLATAQPHPNPCTFDDIPEDLLYMICSLLTQLNDIRAFLSVNQHNYKSISNYRPLWDAVLQNRFSHYYKPDFTLEEIKTVIDLARFKLIDNPVDAHALGVSRLEIEGDKLFSGAKDGDIKDWDLNGKKQPFSLSFSDWTNCFKVQGDFLFVSKNSNILVVDFIQGKILCYLTGHKGSVTCLLIDKGRLYSADECGVIKSWDLNQRKELKTFCHAAQWRLNCLATYQGNLISGSTDCTIKGWDVESGKELYTLATPPSLTSGEELFPGPHSIRKIAIYGNILFAAAPVGSIEVWDLEKKEWLQTLKGHKTKEHLQQDKQIPKFWLEDMIVYKDMLITCSTDKTIKLWNAKTRKELLTLQCNDEVHCIAMHKDKLYAGFENGKIPIWDFNKPSHGASTNPQGVKREEEKTE